MSDKPQRYSGAPSWTRNEAGQLVPASMPRGDIEREVERLRAENKRLSNALDQANTDCEKLRAACASRILDESKEP